MAETSNPTEQQTETDKPVMGTDVRTEVKPPAETDKPVMGTDVRTVMRITDTGSTELDEPHEKVITKPQRPKVPDSLKGLEKQEEAVEAGHRKAIEALRDIQTRRLYRHVKRSDWGSSWRPGDSTYKDWDDYMAKRWQRTRQWASLEIQWLDMLEYAEAHGAALDENTPKATILRLRNLANEPELMVAAIKDAAQHKDKRGALKFEIDRRHKYLQARDEMKAADIQGLTYPEWYGLQQLPTPHERTFLNIPQDRDLLSQARGQELGKKVLEIRRELDKRDAEYDRAQADDKLRKIIAPDAPALERPEDDRPDPPKPPDKKVLAAIKRLEVIKAYFEDQFKTDWMKNWDVANLMKQIREAVDSYIPDE